ncbi:hypothetical protein FRC14_007993 [Serendipita sp. 396]|nr:hypothetical protein FRC14_007993 [Serendipita sp. 396]
MSVAQEGVRHSKPATDLAGLKIGQENGVIRRDRDRAATEAVVVDTEQALARDARDARFDHQWPSSTNGSGVNGGGSNSYKLNLSKTNSSSAGKHANPNSIPNATSEFRESDDEAISEMRAHPERVARSLRTLNATVESSSKPPPGVDATAIGNNESIDARAQVTTPVSPPPSPPTGHAANPSLKPVSTARSISSNHTTPRLSTKSSVEPTENSPTPSTTTRGGAPLASLLLSDHRDATEANQPVVEERKDGSTHVTTPPSPESLAQMGHSRTVSKTDSAFTSIERSSTSKDSRDEEGMDVDPPLSAVSRAADRVRSPSGAPTADVGPLSAVSPRPAPGFPTMTGSASHHSGIPQSSLSPATPITGPSHEGYRSHHHRHSLTQTQGSQIRSRGGEDGHSSKSIPSKYPQPLSPRSQLTSFHTDPAQEKEARMPQNTSERADMLEMIDQQRAMINDLRAQLDHQTRSMDRREEHYRHAERERLELINRVTEWLRTGQQLLTEANAASSAAYQASARPLNSPGVLGRNGTSVSLSSAVASSRAATQRELVREIERDRTLSHASPVTPYTMSAGHGRPSLSHHESRGSLRPMSSPRAEHPPHLSRSNSQQNDVPYRPPHLGHSHSYSHDSSGHSSLRRARRPSSDDLAAAAGGKRIKTDSGNYVRVSGENNGLVDRVPYARDGYDARPSLSSISHRNTGYPNNDTAEHETQAYPAKGATSSRLTGGEHSRNSPLDRRLGGGRIDEEEEFPSPLRSYASTAPTPTVAENGHSIPRMKPSPLREQYKSGPPSASVPAPEEEHASFEAHKALMELGDDEDAMSRAQRSLRRPDSRSGTQDVDEMLAEATGDVSEGRGEDLSRLSSKARYRASASTVMPNPGGTISSFALPAGHRTDSFSRSPEAPGHRASNSGSFSTSSLVSPSAGNGPVHMQFLPPQSGPPMPKKIYHTKNTGQVIGAQNLATGMPTGTIDPTYVAPKPGAPPNSLTIDGLPKRTCKQCGQPGRYRDNKCVEKWGPGPQGPGTVCDRCRKKMKRVEKRATQDSNAMAAATLQHQYPIAPAPNPSGSFSHSQSSQRLEESQDYGYSQVADGHSQPSLSRSGSHNHISRQSSTQLVRRDSTLPYPPPASEETRGAMPPPAAPWSGARSTPESTRRSHLPPPPPLIGTTERSNSNPGSSRDGDMDADGDAEMDELDDDNSATADGAAAAAVASSRAHNSDRTKQELP